MILAKKCLRLSGSLRDSQVWCKGRLGYRPIASTPRLQTRLPLVQTSLQPENLSTRLVARGSQTSRQLLDQTSLASSYRYDSQAIHSCWSSFTVIGTPVVPLQVLVQSRYIRKTRAVVVAQSSQLSQVVKQSRLDQATLQSSRLGSAQRQSRQLVVQLQ